MTSVRGATDLGSIHVALGTGGDRAEVIDSALLVESLGFGGLWIPEATGRDAFSVLSEVAMRTSRIELGTGIINPYSRTPSAIAQAVVGVSEVAGGRRFNLGVGASTRVIIEGFHGVPYDRPLARMREAIGVLRRALRGLEIVSAGPFHQPRGFTLRVPDGGVDARLFVAAVSPRMVGMAGEVADGWLDIYTARDGTGRLGELYAEGRTRSSAVGPGLVASYCYTVVGERAAAMEGIRRSIAWYIGAGGPAYQGKFARGGYPDLVERIVELWQRRDRDAARRLVDDGMVARFGTFGSGSDVLNGLLARRAAGLDIPIVRFPDGVDTAAQRAALEAIAVAAGRSA